MTSNNIRNLPASTTHDPQLAVLGPGSVTTGTRPARASRRGRVELGPQRGTSQPMRPAAQWAGR
jgi:hypothetical protein